MTNPSNTYYLFLNGEQTGPFTMTQLKAMWLNGAITADALYFSEQLQDWTGLGGLVEEAIESDQPSAPPR